jgi:AcrR family transcriptional regulator
VRTRGWDGDLPQNEQEARDRIVAAATRCVDQLGPTKTNISTVAAELGVTRQTVYRYFPRLPDLLAAVAETGRDQFLARMQAHLAYVRTPEEAVTESIVFSLNTIPTEPYIGLLLQAGENEMFSRGATSSRAMSYGAQMLRRMPVDWHSIGVGDADLETLAEIIMRLLVSFLEYPADPPRSDDEMRRLVQRWIGPALMINAHQGLGTE